jgi:hypothetical protein
MTKRMNRAGPLLEEYLLDHGMSPEDLGYKLVRPSGRTIRRVIENKNGFHPYTMAEIARVLNEDLSTIFPPMPRKRIPGGSRKVIA